LAAILDCRFGGPHEYAGKTVELPYIGTNNRDLNYFDLEQAVNINRCVELIMALFVACMNAIFFFLWN
jgi:adenosylcobinamide-phosphate synthase